MPLSNLPNASNIKEIMPISESNQSLPSSKNGSWFLALISLTALTATFLFSNLNLNFPVKFSIFISIVLIYMLAYTVFYFRQRRKFSVESKNAAPETLFDAEVEAKLFALEEARQFFGASLKYADMFRLVASRLNEIIPFATGVLLAVNEEQTILTTQFAVGENMREFADLKINSGSGLSGKVLRSSAAQVAGNLSNDKQIISAKALNNLHSGIAAPLFQGANIFGVLVLYGSKENQFDRNSLELLEAAASRIAPLFLSSRAFENNLTNALTDALTALPNERAFYLVLENQIAEAQRFRGERPLAVLTVDVVNFDEINRKYGHATGDRVLGFAAETIKAQLRQMDFLARATGDEFLAVLPTASESITKEIIERVRKTFVLNPFKISTAETVHLQLNFGTASFGKDGETATTLTKHALLKKRQTKTAESKILFFPKEFVN